MHIQTSSETVVKQHKSINHKTKNKLTKKKKCYLCDKRFNKKETLNKHMKIDHKIVESKQETEKLN